ncbi:MAG: methylated-DNA--[protein]-cysteine S-methyltransferase [Chitinophagaceae bacterium]|nr:methylated-DNA--[protein]-cysteine S-methyltransferase [Chitinophagaceae bacterium]
MEDLSAYYSSPIGALQIKSSGENITGITFVNSEKGKKINEDEIIFSDAGSEVIRKCMKELDEYFSGKRKIFTMNVLQKGTPFQTRVWSQLSHIPFGKTISYLSLSKKIDNVKAIRAVGTTNGANNICIVVPCHRVIGSNGDLTGYGGDLWRKKWLLEHEAKYENGVQKLFE